MAKNEIQKIEPVSPLAAAAELVKAGDNMDVAKLKELLEMQERYDATQAKKAYVVAMAAFKENPPEILKDKSVGYSTSKGTTSYTHASLHNVTTKINAELSKHGLTASWVTSQDNGSVKVECKIVHVMGHSESCCLSAKPDTTGSKNPIQAIGSTVTYLQRYTLLALTGLATADQDDDGKGSAPQASKPTKKDEQNEIVDQAFFNFQTEQKEALAEGFVFSREKFEAAIIKHHKRLPTKTEQIPMLLKTVKPEEVMVEVQADDSDYPEYED
jgi:hypothetical protein